MGSLTELVGESGVGKSHFCLQLLLTVQLPTEAGGLGGRSLYVYTEARRRRRAPRSTPPPQTDARRAATRFAAQGEPRVDRLKEVAHRFARTAEEQARATRSSRPSLSRLRALARPSLRRHRRRSRRRRRRAAPQEDLIDGVLVRKALEGPAELWEVLQQARVPPPLPAPLPVSTSELPRPPAAAAADSDAGPATGRAQADTLLASGVLQPPVRLLVIDSIANPFRDYDGARPARPARRLALRRRRQRARDRAIGVRSVGDDRADGPHAGAVPRGSAAERDRASASRRGRRDQPRCGCAL